MLASKTRSVPSPTTVVIVASVVLAVATGSRASWGLFIGPINSASGFGPAVVSLAVASGALAWGLAQPLCGLLLQRIGAPRLLAAGGVLVAALLAAIPLAASGPELIWVMAAAGAAGAAAGSAPLLMGLVAQRVAPARRGTALGIVSAGGSFGQLASAPLVALAISAFGWQAAIYALAIAAVLVVPLARTFRSPAGTGEGRAADQGDPGVPIHRALRDRNYWMLTAGFFVCGFHVSFLTTHMPGVIELCGLPAGLSGLWLAVVGGIELELTGGYRTVWLIDIALAVAASAVNLPISEAPRARAAGEARLAATGAR